MNRRGPNIGLGQARRLCQMAHDERPAMLRRHVSPIEWDNIILYASTCSIAPGFASHGSLCSISKVIWSLPQFVNQRAVLLLIEQEDVLVGRKLMGGDRARRRAESQVS